jgi:hypothetical protein
MSLIWNSRYKNFDSYHFYAISFIGDKKSERAAWPARVLYIHRWPGLISAQHRIGQPLRQ